jgi:hypothetical protein
MLVQERFTHWTIVTLTDSWIVAAKDSIYDDNASEEISHEDLVNFICATFYASKETAVSIINTVEPWVVHEILKDYFIERGH